VALVCACIGFAYGQRGELHLIRAKGQHAIECLKLGQFLAALAWQSFRSSTSLTIT
jgi:hypothetical protein